MTSVVNMVIWIEDLTVIERRSTGEQHDLLLVDDRASLSKTLFIVSSWSEMCHVCASVYRSAVFL